MPTSKADRLNKLFETDSLPPLPDPSKSHIADTEIQPPQQPWEVPQVAQIPKRIINPPPRTGRDIDQLTSSDDDEYVRAFKHIPTMKAESKPQETSTLGGHPDDKKQKPKAKSKASTNAAVRNEAGQEIDDGLPNVDRDGHALVGRFCPLTLVTKFCYKYMDDPNDRVSRHFFASGKIWNRTWDM